MQLHIRHETTYRYEQPVKYSIQSLRLTPRRDGGQRSLSWRILGPGRRVEQTDAYGNITHLLTYEEAHREVSIVVQGIVETGGSGLIEDEGPLAPLAYLAPTPLTRPDARVRAVAAEHLAGSTPLQGRLERLADALYGSIRYTRGVTNVSDGAATVLERGEGVCQDQAHVFIACCRAAGIPARYVSGYFYTGDAGEIASHAWADAWLGADAGWVSIDLTHKSLAGERHCRLAVGRDYRDAAPVRGVRHGGGGEAMHVAVIVATSSQEQQQQQQQQ
jgi:transglutaminase-like putative cysteine protease